MNSIFISGLFFAIRDHGAIASPSRGFSFGWHTPRRLHCHICHRPPSPQQRTNRPLAHRILVAFPSAAPWRTRQHHCLCSSGQLAPAPPNPCRAGTRSDLCPIQAYHWERQLSRACCHLDVHLRCCQVQGEDVDTQMQQPGQHPELPQEGTTYQA